MKSLFTKKSYSSFKEKILKKVQDKGLFYTMLLAAKKIAVYSLSFPLCILICLIKPIIFIRFGSLNAEKIGPFSAQPELYLCEKDNGIQPKNSVDIFCKGINPYICNYQLLAMWRRLLHVNEASRHLYKMMNMLSFAKSHIIRTTNDSRDIHGLLEKSDIHLEFLPEENVQAGFELSRMGIDQKDKYILMINRGQRYLDQVFPAQDWNYHNFRNCSIDNFILMAEQMTVKGYFVIRMGHLVSDLMNTDNPRVIDYDHKGFRTELLDIYLGANCRFIVGSDTGYLGVPGWLFRRPIVHVNFSEFEYIEPWLSNWLFIFRKYWLKREKRFMTVQEILKSGVGRFQRNEEFRRLEIEIIDNTPEEIVDVVDEMEERLNGTWQGEEQDNELQRRFWSHFKSSELHGIIRSRIGAKFLRQNIELLN